MPRRRTGSLFRDPNNAFLRVRITTMDADGRSYRPWVDLDPGLTDEEARVAARKMAQDACSISWAPPRPRSLRSFPTLEDVLALARTNVPDARVVYFARCAIKNGPTKIGMAENVFKRLGELQTGCPYELELVGTLPGGRAVEAFFHNRFIRLRMRGEWFALTGTAERAIQHLLLEAAAHVRAPSLEVA